MAWCSFISFKVFSGSGDSHLLCVTVYIQQSQDVRRSFDSDDYCILLSKLENWELVDGIDASQIVTVLQRATDAIWKNNFRILHCYGRSPQGSVLAPLLFIISFAFFFIEGLLKLSLKLEIFCHTDDTKSIFAGSSNFDVRQNVEDDHEMVGLWLDDNKPLLDTTKFSRMCFCVR